MRRLIMGALAPALAMLGCTAEPVAAAPQTEVVTAKATSVPCTGTVTSSAATSTAGAGGCTAAFASGSGTLGPFVPQLGRAVRVRSSGTWTGSFYLGTSEDGCATVNRLTAGDSPQPDWTANVNDYADVPPSTGGVAYCLVATITSGTLAAAVRQ